MTELIHGAALGGYRIESLIGQGSTGAVYAAEEVALKRRVALKVLLPELARDERFRERFLRESRLAASLEHPHIVPIHGVGESDGVLFLAMRYVGSRDLAGMIERLGRLEPERAVSICGQIASALDAAHAHDLVHRDVKPGNILLAREAEGDFAYLCDFGLAKHGAAVTSLTGSRAIVGTVGYLSPEQIDGLPVDGRTDVYALGCVLFECLAGAPPFVRDNELATILAHRSEPPPSVSQQRPELPEALDAVIARALAKDREARYGTCGELIRDARQALAGEPVAPPPPHAGPALRTFVFADVRGYTTYTREHGDEAAAQLARQFSAIVEPLVREHGGTVPQYRGDEAMVVFDSARAALRYALDLQRRVVEEGLPRPIGIGIDAGEAVGQADDFHGSALNRAARLCSVARPGEVLASDGVVHLAGRVEGVRYGLRRLERAKGFDRPVGAVEIHPAEAVLSRQLWRRARRALAGTHPRARAAAAGLVVAAAAVAALVATLGGGGTPTTAAAAFAPDSIALVDARTGRPAGTVAPGLHICVFVTSGKELWACDADQSILLRIDARRHRVVDQVPLPVYHGSFTIGFGSIWVGDAASPKVVPVSPRFRTASPAIRLPGVPAVSPTGFPENVGSMVAAHGAIWAAYGFPKRIAKIDPSTRRVLLSRPMRQDCPCDAMLAAGGDKLWAVGGDGRHIYRLDPRTGGTLATGALHAGTVAGAAVAGGYLWVAMTEGGSVWKVDETGAPIDQVRTGAGPSSIHAADGYVWVANADAGTVTRIDPRSNATRSYRVGHRPVAVAELGGTIFVGLQESAAEATAGLRGPKVVRAVAPDYAFASDPVSMGGPTDLVVGAVSGAGLMAARTGDGGRTTIEPELAARPPEVSAGGRTYRFRLEPGLRFSSKEPVTLQAVRFSIERAVAPGLLNHYCRDMVLGDLEGQAAYEAGRAEHISGLRVEGDVLAITLVRPSMTLPARLAHPCLSVVPEGTPTVPGGLGHPIPSAGPYFASSVILGQQIVLRRNPEYRGPRRPALDALILRGGLSPDEAGAAVEQGRADYASSSGRPSPDFGPGGRYEQRFGAPGGRLRFVRPPSQFTQMLIFNTRRGIFRSARLRRAVNLALDRRAIVGPSGGQPRSLLIPPGVPGHRDQGPYGARPDLTRARVLARGLGGTATVAVPAGGPGPDPSTAEVARELSRIGIDVRVRALADPAAAAADPSQGIDALALGWGPDYPDPFDVINVVLQPGARAPIFPDFFGDPRWVRRMQAAAAEPLARRDAAYARLDADLARGPAPVAVLSTPPGAAQLLSSRLGCERFVSGGLVDLGSLCVR